MDILGHLRGSEEWVTFFTSLVISLCFHINWGFSTESRPSNVFSSRSKSPFRTAKDEFTLHPFDSIQFRGTLQNKRHLECLSPRVLGTSYETSFTLGNEDGVGRERVRRKEYFWVFPCVSSKQAQAKDHLFAQASIYLSHRTHFPLQPPPPFNLN